MPSDSQAPTGATWWPGPWLALLALLALAFIAFALPPYLTLDPKRSRILPAPDLAGYYPLLVAHVLFASIAMTTGCLQLWSGLRQRHPAIHRSIGRVYVFAGVIPAGTVGRVIGSVSPFGPTTRASNVLLAILWLGCTVTGFRKGQLRRFAEHRRWMIRSIALTMSIITNRLWLVIFTIVFSPRLATSFGGNEALMVQTIAGLSSWLGWVLPLLAVEWWLVERGRATRAAAMQV
jgi:hypothetical protein